MLNRFYLKRAKINDSYNYKKENIWILYETEKQFKKYLYHRKSNILHQYTRFKISKKKNQFIIFSLKRLIKESTLFIYTSTFWDIISSIAL